MISNGVDGKWDIESEMSNFGAHPTLIAICVGIHHEEIQKKKSNHHAGNPIANVKSSPFAQVVQQDIRTIEHQGSDTGKKYQRLGRRRVSPIELQRIRNRITVSMSNELLIRQPASRTPGMLISLHSSAFIDKMVSGRSTREA
jgi:hypothetical protein